MRAIAPRMAPYAVTMKGYRCLFLDIVSAGKGGPDFRIDPAQRRWIETELDGAGARGERAVVFMHAYPGDLRDDPDGIGGLFAAHRVAFVDTGHTHYNELLNDGRVVYGATRSTAQTEEGLPGSTIVTLDDGVPSWRFHAVDRAWPMVQITTPADRRLVTDPDDARHVPHRDLTVRATVLGDAATVCAMLDDTAPVAMTRIDATRWTAAFAGVAQGLHRVTVTADHEQDVIEVLVREPSSTPKRNAPVAPGRDVNTIGAWPEAGIAGSRLGPNRNGADW